MKKVLIDKIVASIIICFIFMALALTTVSASSLYTPAEPLFGNYFVSDYETRKDVLAANRELNEEIVGEGLVLLKNESSLPIGGDLKVSVFGKNSVNVMSGGSGSGAGGGVPITGFIDALQQEGFSVNPTLVNFYKDNS